MREINTYIIEKLKINKDSKVKLVTPKNNNDLKTLVEEYFWEWVENDEIFKNPKASSKEDMKGVYNSIMKSIEDNKYTFKKLIRWVLPLKFRQYLNKNYYLKLDEKL